MSKEYIMESSDEVRRLEMKTDASAVEACSARAGLCWGMRVVDAGCGPGVTTAALSRVVGDTGSALGFDISEKRIERARNGFSDARTSFAVRDFREPLGDLGTFDFAWMRFALEYYKAESFDIARNVSSLLAEGGVLCLVDLDYNCLSHYGISPRLENALFAGMRQLEAVGNFDPYVGRKLYSYLYRMGYRDIKVEASAHHCIYGKLNEVDEYNWGKKIEVLARKIKFDIPGYSGPEEFQEDFMAFFRDPGRFTYTPLIAAWGRKA
jgi:SAM-dependent methyltransferase